MGTFGNTFGDAWVAIQVGTVLNQTTLLERNADIVEAGGYYPITADGVDVSIPVTGRWFLNKNNLFKVRQSGLISKVKFYCQYVVNIDNIYLQFWGKDGTTYDLRSQYDLRQNLNSDGVVTVDLLTPILAESGDYIGIGGIVGIGNAQVFVQESTANQVKYINGANPGATNVAFDAGSSLAYVWPVKVYGQSPLVVVIGDSIAAGHPAHYSYVEVSETDSVTSSILYQLQQIDALYVGQNMGIGSQTSTQVAGRFTADVVALKPKIALILVGINDISNGNVTKATFLANYTAMLDACVTASIIPVVCKIIPWTAGTTAQMRIRDEWNADLAALVATYTGAICIDFDTVLGQYDPSGDVGNLWDIKTEYNADNVHLNILGYTAMAVKIDAEIKALYRFVLFNNGTT